MRHPNVTSLCFATRLAFSATEVFPAGTISVNFCAEVKKGRLRYKMAKKYCRKYQSPELGARTLQTIDGFAIAKART